MHLVENERLKYLATFLNTVAVTAIAAGVVAPLVAWSYGLPGPITGWAAVLISVIWLSIGSALHLSVRVVLGRLRP